MGLSKEQRAEARKQAEAGKASRIARRVSAAKAETERQKTVREKLSRYEYEKSYKPTLEVCVEASKKAPRLFESGEYREAVERMKGPYQREPRTWEPRGKGRETLFRSLAEHLYAKYPMAPFVWSVFFERETNLRDRLIALVESLAAGNSFIEEVKTGGLPIPLTRKMCHEVLQSSSDVKFLEAVRRVQVRTSGGDDRLWKAWIRTNPGRSLLSEKDEAFWATALHWLAQNPMLDRTQVGPMADYIQFRRNEDPEFSMKGRSAPALYEAMQFWHGDLQRAKASAGQIFMPSGFRGFELDNTRQTSKGLLVEIWRISEILSGKALAAEGRSNRHCVYSYARSIENQTTSIWSMTREDNTGNWHAVTIEVRNTSRSIVQVRGICNRPATGPEANVLSQWAESNQLKVSSYL